MTDLETQINRDLARHLARRLANEAPGLHHARVTCDRGGCSVVLRPRDADRLEEVRAAMRRIFGPCALGAMVSVVPDRVRCTQHSDCREHLDLGRACWEASRDR